MIIVKLNGGLGNQMFQYALGRHLAEIHQRTLLLDANSLSNPESNLTPRVYELDVFEHLAGKLVGPNQLKALRRRVPYTSWYVEGRLGFYAVVLEKSNHPAIGIDGYWQSEKYFRDIAPIIRQDFSFRDGMNDDDTIGLLRATEAVCVHVRRGDYLGPIGAHMGFVGEKYYHRAIEIVRHELKDPMFFVFSDDIAWCKSNLSLPIKSTFVEAQRHTRSGSHLKMMSQCKHFVIANSSFSWWAAWLSSNPNKLVIAPQRWFAREGLVCTKEGERFVLSKDIVPEVWKRV